MKMYLYVLGVLMLAAVLGIGSGCQPGAPVPVPNVVGMTQAAAGAAITNAGLTVGAVTEQYSATVPAGRVTSQMPAFGNTLIPGEAVALVLSKGPQPAIVPNVAGQDQISATFAIIGVHLIVGEVSREYHATVPSGSVISQSPEAGTPLTPGMGVDFVLSKGPQPVTVPNVVGMTQAAAGTAITNAGLTVGAVTQQYSTTVPAGSVISQDPLAGASVALGAVVTMVVSKGPQPVTVPNVVGMPRAAAGTAITNVGLTVGAVTEQYSPTVPAGSVISQTPVAWDSVLPGTAVDLTVSKGPQPVPVPNVVGMTQAAAGTAITNAGLTVGAVTQQYNASVPAGTVISQNPLAGVSVLPGTAVALVVSRGPQPVTVPNVVGMTQAAAGTALTNAGLTAGVVTEQHSATVPAGRIISQTPGAGASALPGSAVALVVSKGVQPVTVPDVVGMTQAAAGTTITNAGLAVGAVTQQYSATVPAGRVISQTPAGGAVAPPGSAVALVVSKGVQPVTVPDVAGMIQAAADTAITNAGLTVGAATQQYSATVPAGNVISQNPPAGAVAPPGTAVTLVISRGPQPVIVPNVLGMTQAAAGTAITNAGLTVGAVTQQYSATVPAGNVISQDPLAGLSAPPGTAVALVVSSGPQPVPVPDVVGMLQADAEITIAGAGFTVGAVFDEHSATVPVGNVIRQNPLAGDSALPGAPVDLFISIGPAPVTVPDVVGMPQADAENEIAGAGLAVGAVTEDYSATVPAGSVISQNPLAGGTVLPGSAVDLVVSLGGTPVTVPNVAGMLQADAESAIVGAGLTVGVVTTQYSDTVAAGLVISQVPFAGDGVPPGTWINLVVSLGIMPVTVPDVVGLLQATAESTITGAGLTAGVVSEQYSATVPAGNVMSQSPLAGDSVPPGTAVDLVVSKGVQMVTVPDIVGLSGSDATTAIVNAGLVVGVVTQEYSDTVPVGSVISQSPLPGESVPIGSAVNGVVSNGPYPRVPVPDVVGLLQADAESTITGAGLTVGVVTTQYSATVPAGNVISQNPLAGFNALTGSAVDLVVSLGNAPVPDVVGLSQAAATTAITDADYTVGTVVSEYSATVPVGDVISQSPLAGVVGLPGDPVDLVVSLGPQPVPVPDVVGMAQAAAETAITGTGLVVGVVTTQYSATVASGDVISENPPVGGTALPGSAVDLVVSLGPVPVPVPDVVGLLQADAESAITGVGLTVGAVTQDYSSTVPAGNVISQFPLGGDSVPPGTAVDLVVSKGVQMVTVPDVVGLSGIDAGMAIVNAGLVLGIVTQEYSDTVPADLVISQSPLAGESVPIGSAVGGVVSKGPRPLVLVPNVVGQPQATAETTITGALLVVGMVSTQYSATVPAGDVISQNPLAGDSVLADTPVDLVVSLGPTPVPDVVGLSQAAAETAILGAGYTVGAVTTTYSATVPTGTVISQNPVAGVVGLSGDPVDLVVSLGPQPVPVPNVVGAAQAAAETTITGAGFVVGVVSTQYSATVPAGDVLSQNPVADTPVVPGSPVDLVVSLGHAPVPDVVGLPQVTAESAITGADYAVGVVTTAYSATVPAGDVISQNPVAGVVGLSGDPVDLVVSLGHAPVPDVVGLSQAAATTAITDADYTVGGVTTAYSVTVPAGDVISQNPVAGVVGLSGDPVDLVVSLGHAPVPDVVGLSQAAATTAITDADYTVGGVTTAYSVTVPAGDVISQNPVAGAVGLSGDPVDLVVSLGPAPVTVPDVVGLLQADAESAITGAGLVAGIVTQEYSATVPVGSVISQSPLAGDSVPPGTAVDLIVSKGVQMVTVPDVVGLSGIDAGMAIINAGLVLGIVTQEYSDIVPADLVISQSPLAGESVPIGSAVGGVVSKGPQPPVPNVVGLPQASAEAAILGADYTVGTVTTQYSATVPAGDVISQNPVAGVVGLSGDPVDLVVSLGHAPVPDVVGLSQAAATTAITDADYTVGVVTYANDDIVPAGDVISQNPVAGMVGLSGDPVDLAVSLGPV